MSKCNFKIKLFFDILPKNHLKYYLWYIYNNFPIIETIENRPFW